MDFRRAAKVLSDELAQEGYKARLDTAHNHPRLYIESGGKSAYAILSATASYSEGNLLDMKRQDIRRDVLPALPKPTPTKTPAVEPAPTKTPPNARVYSLKAFVMGRGSLVVQLPHEAIPQGRQRASVFITQANHLYLIFSATSGTEPSTAKSDRLAAYYFKRRDVPFTYAKRGKTPPLCARPQGDSLVCDEPLPPEFLTPEEPKGGRKSTTLDDGTAIRAMLNDWLAQAEAEGLAPTLTVRDNRAHIAVAVKVEKEL